MTSSVDQKYYIRTTLFMAGYTFFLIASMTGAFDDITSRGGWGLGLAATAPAAGCLWALLSWMHHSDEFIRALSAKRFVVATGITLALLSGWGFAEMVAKAPRFPLSLILPLFWIVRGIVTPFVRTSHG